MEGPLLFALRVQGDAIGPMVQPDDVVLLHDPQTAGLVPLLAETGAVVVWRCHIGVDRPNDVQLKRSFFRRQKIARDNKCAVRQKDQRLEALILRVKRSVRRLR